MLGHLEPASRNHGGIVALAQMIIEALRIAALPQGKGGHAVLGRSALDVASSFDEAVEQLAVPFEQRGIVADNFLDPIEREACKPLGLVRLVNSEQVIEAPHSLREIRFGENPAAAKAAEAVDLRQAVGADELRS